MSNKTAYLEKAYLNAKLRALTTAVSGSNASTSNLLVTNSTGYNVGDVVQVSSLSTLHRVTAVPDGTHVTVSPVTSGTVTTGNVVRVAYAPPAIYVGLYTAAPTDAGGGTECTGNGYARVQVTQADGSWSAPGGSTSAAVSGSNASTTNILVTSSTGFNIGDICYVTNATEISRHTVSAVPDGTHVTISPAAGATPTTGTLDRPTSTSNSAAVTFPTSTGTWGGTAVEFALHDALTAGNILDHAPLTTPQSIAASGITPSFAVGTLAIFED